MKRFGLWPTPWRVDDGGRTLRGDALPVAFFGLVLRVSGADQLWLSAFAGLIAVLSTVPLEVQRRVVDRSLKEGSFRSILAFVAAFVGAALLQGSAKLLYNVYRSWVSEHAVRSLRTYVNWREDAAVGGRVGTMAASEGTEISMIVAEAEPVGSFVGESVSEPLLQAGIMASVMVYLVVLQPVMAVVIGAVFLPQLLFVPLMQRAITARARERIATLRAASAALVGEGDGEDGRRGQDDRFGSVFALNMGIYRLKFTMNFLTNLCHQLGVAGILGIGGWFVVRGETQVGTVVAFISGLATMKDPWDDLTTWFQTMMVTRARYKLMRDVLCGTDEPGR